MGWTVKASGTVKTRPWTSPIMSSGNRLMCHAVAVLPLRLDAKWAAVDEIPARQRQADPPWAATGFRPTPLLARCQTVSFKSWQACDVIGLPGNLFSVRLPHGDYS